MAQLDVLEQVQQRIWKETGSLPDTKGWVNSLNTLEDRKIAKQDILKLVDVALSDTYHRPRFLDRGMRYIEWNFNLLNEMTKVSVITQSVKRRVVMATTLSMRRIWEVRLHEWTHAYFERCGEMPTSKEADEQLERVCNELTWRADELQDYQCSKCEWGTVNKKFKAPVLEPGKGIGSQLAEINDLAMLAQLDAEVA